jgi:chaperonin GroEL
MKKDNSTQVLFGDEARARLMQGVNLVTDATITTLGPRGNNVAIDKEWEHIVLHDGVSVASSVNPRDPFAKLGAKIIKEAAKKQRDEVGDGTTVVLSLAQAILKECLKIVAAGVNPMSLRPGLEKGAQKIIEEIRKYSRPIETLEEKREIATISAENAELGEMVANTLEDIGKDGVVTVEESKSAETNVEKQEGMQFAKGYISPYFITDPPTMTASLEDPYIFITDKNIANIMDYLPFLERFVKQSRILVIIAQDITGTALASFIQNKIEGKLLTLCVRAPSFGVNQKAILQDIAVLTGGTFFSEEAGFDPKDIQIEQLGRAKRISSDKEVTLIVGGGGQKGAIEERIGSIKTLLEKADGEFDKQKLRERIGKLSSGVAVIRVGGNTEVEMKERKERVIDAVSALRAAMTEGIVPGGEIIYLRAREALGADSVEQILYRALEKPFVTLTENAGLNSGQLLERLRSDPNGATAGVDVIDGEIKDMISAGIVDPTKVAIEAVKNSLSVAIQVMTCGAAIVPDEVPELPSGNSK